MIITKIEDIENEFIEHLKQVFYNSVSKRIRLDVEYFIGKSDKHVKGVFFEISSEILSTVYNKFQPMKDHQVVADIEDKFINELINDLVIAGVKFLNIEAMAKMETNYLKDDVVSKRFRNIVPSSIIYLN